MGRKITKVIIWSAVSIFAAAAALWLTFVPSAKEPGYVFVASWGAKGSAPGQFHDPTGIAISGQQVFVSDARNGRIQVFDFEGKFLRVFGKPGKGLGELGRPMNLAVKDGEVYVPEYFNDRIQVFALDGTPLRVIGKPGAKAGQFNAPGGIAIGSDGSIFVADFYNHRIQRLSSTGEFVRQWGRPRSEEKGSGTLANHETNSDTVVFSYPTDVAVSSNGTLYIADGYNDRIQQFSTDGALVRKWGGPFAMNIHGPFNGWFATVTGVAIGPQGNVFVADFYNHRVQKFSPNGVFLTSIGHRRQSAGQLSFPIGIAIAQDGTVFVVEYGNNRISKWRSR